MDKSKQLLEAKLKETRDLSVKEGAAASVMNGAVDAYIMPFALELKADNLQIGLLASLNGLISPIIQIFGSRLMERFNRRTISFVSVLLQASAVLGFMLIGLTFMWKPNALSWPLLFLIAYLIYGLAGSLGGPAWFSMIGDAVPEKMRGRYFSQRNRISNYVSITVTLAGSVLLFYAKASGFLIAGFVVLFAIGSFGRFISASLIKKHYASKINLGKENYFSFFRFVRNSPKTSFGRFAIYAALISLTVNIANPFFAVYMWKSLALNPIWFMAVTISTTFYSAISMKLWGRFADKYGNKELLRVSYLLFAPSPLFWIFSPNPIYLILVPQLLMGIGWAGFALASTNYIYDSVSAPKRGIILAYYNLLNGIGVFVGATLGGLLSQYLSFSFMNVFFSLFILSAILRVAVSIWFLPKLNEVRKEIVPPESNPLRYLSLDHIKIWRESSE